MAKPLTLNLAAFRKGTRMTGPGLRDALWVQGCSIRCPGCANQAYLARATRVLVPVSRLVDHFAARRGLVSGVSALGGEPTEQAEAVTALFQGVKELGMTTVLFSGRVWESLLYDHRMTPLMEVTDLLIDGPFLIEEQDLRLHWRGSRNQRLIRLSDAFAESDLSPTGPNGEVLFADGWISMHGVGTRSITNLDCTGP